MTQSKPRRIASVTLNCQSFGSSPLKAFLNAVTRSSWVFSEECSLEQSCAAWSTLEWFSEVDDMEKLDDVSTHSHCIHCLAARLRSCARALHQDPQILGSSPSSFTTHETKVHAVCGSKLNNWWSVLGDLRTILADLAKFIPHYFVKKVATTQKKVLKLGIQKVVIFSFYVNWGIQLFL